MTDTATSTLTDFLLARVAEDEAVARAIPRGEWWYPTIHLPDDDEPLNIFDSECVIALAADYPTARADDQVFGPVRPEATATHIARHDPARVLAECEAKRRIVELLGAQAESGCDTCGCPWPGVHEDDCGGYEPARETLRILAAVYADHPDYRDEWRP